MKCIPAMLYKLITLTQAMTRRYETGEKQNTVTLYKGNCKIRNENRKINKRTLQVGLGIEEIYDMLGYYNNGV